MHLVHTLSKKLGRGHVTCLLSIRMLTHRGGDDDHLNVLLQKGQVLQGDQHPKGCRWGHELEPVQRCLHTHQDRAV